MGKPQKTLLIRTHISHISERNSPYDIFEIQNKIKAVKIIH